MTEKPSNSLVVRAIIVILMTIAAVFGVQIAFDPVLEPMPSGGAGRGEWYDIYFTDPVCPPEEERSGGLDETIAEDLERAAVQVDVAAFDLDAEPMVDALIALEKRGVRVRVITDSDNANLHSINRLRRNGISVVEDKRSGLMHNKFVVIDGRYLWMGSMNFTSNGAYCNNNNLVRFDSPRLAANYLTEMDEMYDDGSFGPSSPQNTPNEDLMIQGVLLQNYFASEKALAPIIAEIVNRADNEILFLAFSFTLPEIADAMLARAETGVNVKGVFETSGADTLFSTYPEMDAVGLSNVRVRQDGNDRIMHHKVIIVDRKTVIFGSYNFSNNANDNNDENIIVVYDPEFAGFFVDEFFAVWDEAKPD